MSDKLKKIFDTDEQGLLNVPQRQKSQTSSDRLESSFLEINDFYFKNNRQPDSKTKNLSERKLGIRLKGIRADEDKVEALKHLDIYSLLMVDAVPENIKDVFSDDDLGLFDDSTGILNVRNVPLTKVATEDYIARRQKVADFSKFEGLFIANHEKLKKGEAELINFETESQIQTGRFYILKGLMVFIAHIGEKKRNKNGDLNARTRIIFENGTESSALVRSIARSLHDDGKIVVDLNEDILIPDVIEEDDQESGYIYVLSSLSEDPKVANILNLYKIGFSTTTVEQRIKNAVHDPTYLMADVKIRASYKTYNMNTHKLESLLHRVFAESNLDIQLTDKNGKAYIPSEWFVAPLEIIDKVINMIVSGDIVDYKYDAINKQLVYIG